MTPDIMKMDSQELCRWLQDHFVFKNASITDCCIFGAFDDENSTYNIPACAFAARDYIANTMDNTDLKELYEKVQYLAHGMIPFWAPPIYWLRAAALVIAGKGEE